MRNGLKALFNIKCRFGTQNDIDIIEKELRALNVISKYYSPYLSFDELMPYGLKDEQYVSSGSCKVMSKEEYELLKEVLK